MNTVQVILTAGLTLAVSSYILNKVRKNKSFSKIIYSQSTIHLMIRDFIPKDIFDKPQVISQSVKHTEKNTVKVIFIEDKAYWVTNNIFYGADAVDGFVDMESTKPIDTANMSQNEIDKMLFILDNLRDGIENDSGSTGNKRL
jgi:hypothetical protein